MPKKKPARKTAKKRPRAIDPMQRRLNEANALMNVVSALASTDLSIDERLDQCLAVVLKQFSAIRGSIMILDPAAKELVVRSSTPEGRVGFRQPLEGDSISAKVARQGRALNQPAKGQKLKTKWSDYKSSAFLSHPILSGKRVVGVFNITDKKSGGFTRVDEKALARFIDRIAAAIEFSELQEQLRATKENLEHLMETAPDPIVIHRNGEILYVNKACLTLLRMPTRAGIIGKNVLRFLHPSSHEIAKSRIAKMADGRRFLPPVEEQVLTSDGEIRDVELASSAVSYGGRSAVQVIMRDITDRKRHENEMRRAKEEAETATALKDKFVSLVSHDLKAPLASLLSLQRLFKRTASDRLNEQERNLLDRALESTDAMQSMISRLLDISLLQTGKLALHKRFHELHDQAAEAIGTVQNVAAEKDVKIAAEIPPGVRCHVDRELMWQVLTNLLSNAIKFSRPGGSIVLRGRTDKETVTIEVRDDGVGIKKEFLANLFRHEVKTTSNGTSGEKGTGLGLPFCHEIVRAHGGSITAESEDGKGSLFRITLPHVRPQVMVVDDNSVDIFLARKFLEPLDVDIIDAASGEEALALAKRTPPHLIVADLHLAGESGLELLESLQGDPALKTIPAIITTVDTSIANREKAFALGARDFVSKPLQPHDFIPRVKRFLH